LNSLPSLIFAPRAFAITFPLLLLALVARPQANRDFEGDPGLKQLQIDVRADIAGRKWGELQHLAESGALIWLAHPDKQDEKWGFHVVKLPRWKDEADQYLAVFSMYHSCQSIGDHFHKLVKSGDGWKIGPEVPETETLGYRVRDHQLDVRFNLEGKSAFFKDEVKMERTRASANSVCLLRLSSNLVVDDVKRGEAAVPFAHAPGLIAVVLPDERQSTLTVNYHGSFNASGMDTYVNEREVFLNSYWYPHIGRLPARHGVSVTVPKGWTAIGQGNLLSRKEGSSSTTFSFRNEIPVCYFSLDAGAYRVTSKTVGSRVYAVYQLDENPQAAERALDELMKCLPFYEKSFGKYPYPSYTLVQTKGSFGGALEAYSFSTYAGRGFGGVAHEVSHTWWGGIVPNTYTRTMWNEWFANYCDGLFRRQASATKPAHALTGMHSGADFGRLLLRAYSIPMSRAFDTENGPQNSVGYGKGSLVLAMLEDEIGTEKMLASMRRFVDDHPVGEAAEWPEFEKAVEKTTGSDMNWFFEQWVERSGVPVVRLANVRSSRVGANWSVTGTIEQEGKPYRLRLPVVVECASGKNAQSVAVTEGSAQRFTITTPSRPTAALLDPEGTVLMAGGTPAGRTDSPFRVVLP
jgi:Aminopeptidase N